MWIKKSAIFLLILNCGLYVLADHEFYQYTQLYEGSRCKLANGAGEGVCVKAINCPARIQQVFRGNYSAAGRCGFDKFDEIFCCAISQPFPRLKAEVRPAEAACQKHKELFKELDPHGNVYNSVINGVLTRPGEFPHMAALGYIVPEEKAIGRAVKYHCGGTLISNKHVLTAAHCVDNAQGLVPAEVLLGTNDLGRTESSGRQRVPISRIIKHPEYKLGLNYHDLAILELEDPVEFAIDVYPTCLMTEPLSRGTVTPRTSLVALGWGAVDLEGSNSTKLLKAERLKFVSKKSCWQSYSLTRVNIPNGLNNGMICVKDPDTTRRADTCWGEGGGPLLISSPKFPRLIGVSSFGRACGESQPGVFGAVYKYLDWIENQVWPATDSN